VVRQTGQPAALDAGQRHLALKIKRFVSGVLSNTKNTNRTMANTIGTTPISSHRPVDIDACGRARYARRPLSVILLGACSCRDLRASSR
jgi:hypothetical protein